VSKADAVAELDQALTCTQTFSPQDVLIDLQHEGWIATKPAFVMDGIPSFPTVKPLRLRGRGLAVKFVSGWAPHGSLFSRAPGTAPDTFVSVAVEATPEIVAEKLGAANAQAEPPHRLIGEEIIAYGYRKHPGLTEVECDLGP